MANDEFLTEDEIIEIYGMGYFLALDLAAEDLPLIARENPFARRIQENPGLEVAGDMFDEILDSCLKKVRSIVSKLDLYDKLYFKLISSLKFEESRMGIVNPRRLLRPAHRYGFSRRLESIKLNSNNNTGDERLNALNEIVSIRIDSKK